jgi:hypothetical protein
MCTGFCDQKPVSKLMAFGQTGIPILSYFKVRLCNFMDTSFSEMSSVGSAKKPSCQWQMYLKCFCVPRVHGVGAEKGCVLFIFMLAQVLSRGSCNLQLQRVQGKL